MSKGLQACFDALDRLKNGTPHNPNFVGLPLHKITNSIVSQEAGFGAGYLKNSRPQHRGIITLIASLVNEVERPQTTRQLALEKRDKKITQLKEEIQSYKTQLDTYRNNELFMYRHAKELERQLEKLKALYNDR